MTGADEFDLGPAPVEEGRLTALHSLLKEATDLEVSVAQMEEDLKAAKANLNAIKAKHIPESMAELQMESIVWNGWEVKIGDFVSGSLPSDPERRDAAIRWLEANDGGDIIKTDVKASFGRSQHNEALDAAGLLRDRGYSVDCVSGVHASTLQAFARERIKNGDPIDTDTLGLYTGRVAKIKPKKA